MVVSFRPTFAVFGGQAAAESGDLEGAQSVQGGLEVVQDDRVGQTFEHVRQLPEGVQAVRQLGFERVGDGQDVEDDEGDAQDHGAEHDGEPGRDADDLRHRQLVARLDVVEERDRGEDPPGVAVESGQMGETSYM